MQHHGSSLLLGALVLGLPACAANAAPGPGLTYSVAIDPSFTTDQTEAITAGIESWNAAVPELHVTYAIAACDSPAPNQVCMHPNSSPPDTTDDIVGDTQSAGDDNSTVMIFIDRIQAAVASPSGLIQQTAAHEMGHALGLKHSATGTLMAAYVMDQASAITPADIAQFWSVRGK
jgi:predicted Zn-dependent protease